MKIRMLGTGYGECKIKKKISKDYRKSGGVLIDEGLLIDAPTDIFDVAEELGLSDLLTKISDVLISHSHPAHFSCEALAKLSQTRKINVYATRAVLSSIPHSDNLTLYEITPFTKFTLLGYEITALPTNHKTEISGEQCLNFLLRGEKSLFYALDGGWINYEAYPTLKECTLDAVIADTALEILPTSEKSLSHNDIHTVKKIKDLFLSAKIAHENTRFILSHIPTSKKRAIHDELSPIAKEYGLTLSYDGYFIRF